MKIGLVGAGNTVAIADQHAIAFKRLPQTAITAIFDLSREYAEAFLKRNSLNAPICDTYDQLLNLVDAVCICTPNQTHACFATQALLRGKAVLCEKPLGGTPEELAALSAAASRPDAPLNVTAYVCRYMSTFMEMRKIVASGGIGKPYYFVQQRGGNRLSNAGIPFEWRMDARTNGGSIVDYGAHALDIFLFITGKTPDEIESAIAEASIVIPFRHGKGGNIAVTSDDCGTAVFHCRSGPQVTLITSRVGYPFGFTEIVGSKGMLLFTDDRPLELRFWTKDPGGAMQRQPQILPLVGDDSHYLQAKAFVSAWENREKLEPSLAYGVDLLRRLGLAQQSLTTERRVHI